MKEGITVSLKPATSSFNVGLAQQSPLSPTMNASLLHVAESSSQYEAFTRKTGATPSLVPGGPAMEHSTKTTCAGWSGHNRAFMRFRFWRTGTFNRCQPYHNDRGRYSHCSDLQLRLECDHPQAARKLSRVWNLIHDHEAATLDLAKSSG